MSKALHRVLGARRGARRTVDELCRERPVLRCRRRDAIFWALGLVASWFFAYILVHEALTARYAVQRPSAPLVQLTEAQHDAVPRALRVKLAGLAAEGAAAFGYCAICHEAEPGRERFGPGLYGVLGAEVGRMAGYGYSGGLLDLRGHGETWTVPAFWAFVHEPEGFAPETRMPFPGLKDDAKVRALVHYLAWAPGLYPSDAVKVVRFDLAALGGYRAGQALSAACIGPSRTVDEAGAMPLESADTFLLPESLDPCAGVAADGTAEETAEGAAAEETARLGEGAPGR